MNGSATTAAITATTTYTLTCTGAGGSGSATTQVALTSATSFVVTPKNAALTLSQTKQFTAAVTGGGAVTWNVDGVPGGSAALGTISATGVYTPPSTPGTHTVSATSVADATQGGTSSVAVTDLAGVYTYHNDAARTGQNLKEYALTPASVGGGSFGKQWSCAVDQDVYAQPLYVANVTVSGAKHNLLIIATQNNSIYVFDADDPACTLVYPKVSAMPTGATYISYADLGGCNDIAYIGITGTPVIDPATNMLYFITNYKLNGNFYQQLHGLNLATGTEPVAAQDIASTLQNFPGTGAGGSTVPFQAQYQNNRAGLALYNGSVYVSWASHCDAYTWWGWLVKYSATTLAYQTAMNVAPNGTKGGIWMSGGAPALDSAGNMFLSTGNGSFNDQSNATGAAATNSKSFSMSFLNLSPATLYVQDFYAPADEGTWSNGDEDISSGGVTVLPDGVGPTGHPNLIVGGDKQSHIWLLDRAALGQFNAADGNAVQFTNLPKGTTSSTNCNTNCIFATPAYYNGTIYLAPALSPLMAMTLQSGLFNTMNNTVIPDQQSSEIYGFPGASPEVTASPSGGAVIWTLDNTGYGNYQNSGAQPARAPATLRAYDASTLATLWSSTTLAADNANGAVKFTLPTIANGHVYIGGTTFSSSSVTNNSQVTVYGLSP